MRRRLSKNARNRCIYCTLEKPVAEFNREHVLHEAFGLYKGGLTLPKNEWPGVCKKCNSGFGDSIDRVLTRDSYQALLRVRHELKSPMELGDLFHERVRFTLPESSPFGPLKVNLAPTPDGSGVHIVPLPQVRFRRHTGGHVCYTEGELQSTDPAADPTLDTSTGELLWFSADENAQERLLQRLLSYGIDLRSTEPLPLLSSPQPESLEVEITSVVDALIARAVAKIAFNYLAYVARRLVPDLVFRSEFDPVRAFIWQGEGKWRAFMRHRDEPVLIGETPQLRRTKGHLLTVTWKGRSSAPVVVLVALFNDLVYEVRLAKRVGGLWVDIAAGHHFNPETKTVERLHKGRLVVPPPLVW